MLMRAILIGVTVLLFLGLGGYAIYSTLNKPPEKVPPEELTFEERMAGCDDYMGRPDRKIMAEGAKAFEFDMTSIDDQPVVLKKLLKKSPVLVELFASWCPHCQASVPAVKEINTLFQDKVSIVAINAGDSSEEPSTSKAFRDEYKITYPILERPSQALKDQYCLTSFPTFYLLDKEGLVIWRHVGSLEAEGLSELKKKIKENG